MNKSLTLCILFLPIVFITHSQQDTTTVGNQGGISQDDPSNYVTRLEFFSEYLRLQNGEYLNVSTLRSLTAIGKRFSTRLDIPIVYNSTPGTEYDPSGIGDISVRLLGYRIMEGRHAAMLTSLEFSFNTAQSPLLGTGKNVIVPVIAYSWRVPNKKAIVALSFQQYFSLWGDESRADIQWMRVQLYYLQVLSRKFWTLVLPEYYLDYAEGDPSMNLEAYAFYRVSRHFSFWIKAGSGLFGEHIARYDWTAETGLRYLFLRKLNTQ